MKEWAGVNPQNGKPQWWHSEIVKEGKKEKRDIHGDLIYIGKKWKTSKYDSASSRFVGISAPIVTGALNQYFYLQGNRVYDDTYAKLMHDGFDTRANLITEAWDKSGGSLVIRLRLHVS